MKIPLRINRHSPGFTRPYTRNDPRAGHRRRARKSGRPQWSTGFPSHPSWGNHAEELLFHTSRYYAYTEDFLRQVSGLRDFSFNNYRAQSINQEYRATMARLLRRPAGRTTARAVIALVYRIQGCGKRPRIHPLHTRHPTVEATPARDRRRTDDLPAEDPFLNLIDRFGVPVRRQGRHLWVPFPTLKPLLDAPNPALRQAFHDAVERLHEGGFHLHGMRRSEGDAGRP